MSATNDPRQDNPRLLPYPSWCEIDGIRAGVTLWVTGGDEDLPLELTVAEALKLSRQLLVAAEVVIAR